MALRYDTGKLAKIRKTNHGYARVDARLTRTGIFEYTRGDGSTQLEYRPESEVFKADSLESLESAPVTDLHPSELVTIENTKALSVGVTGSPRRDGKFVSAVIQIQDAGAIAKIDAGDRREISCGYTCDYDPTPGMFEGKRYDGVQRNIQYNHVAIGPANWGRAGSEVAMRLDSVDGAISNFDSEELDPSLSGVQGDLVAIKINGVELKLDARDEQIVSSELARLQTAHDEAAKRADSASATAGKAAVELAAANVRAEKAEAVVAKLDRAELETQARKVLGAEAKFDGKSDAQLRAEVVTAVLPQVRVDGADKQFLDGAFAAALQVAARADSDKREVAKVVGQSTATISASDKAREEMIARNVAASKVSK
jgi:hypothetical protein